jgi:hypothetical protein
MIVKTEILRFLLTYLLFKYILFFSVREKYGDMMDRMIKQAMGSQLGMSSNHSTGQTLNTSGMSTSSGCSTSTSHTSSGWSSIPSSYNDNRKHV